MQKPQSISIPLSTLVRRNFASIFASLLPLHSHGTPDEQQKAGAVLQMDMLLAAELTEDERDTLIRNHMVSTHIFSCQESGCLFSLKILIADLEKLQLLQIAIVSFLFRLCGDVETPQPPHFTKDAISAAVRTVVDGFLDM